MKGVVWVDFKCKEQYSIEDLLAIMAILRGEGGCPWDREQTHQSIRKNFIEETYEVCEAIDTQDPALLKEELGDVLLQIVFHAQMEQEQGAFSFDDVADGICKKLIVRHPHVFGEVKVSGAAEVLDNWSEIKNRTKGITSGAQTLQSVPKQLPALMRAQKVQERANKVNAAFAYENVLQILSDLESEVAELSAAVQKEDALNISEEIGDVLFAAVNAARNFKLDPEELLNASTDKFIKRFAAVETLADAEGIDFRKADFDSLNVLWKKAKQEA